MSGLRGMTAAVIASHAHTKTPTEPCRAGERSRAPLPGFRSASVASQKATDFPAAEASAGVRSSPSDHERVARGYDRPPLPAPFAVGTKLRHTVDGREVVIVRVDRGHRGSLEQVRDSNGDGFEDLLSVDEKYPLDETIDGCSIYINDAVAPVSAVQDYLTGRKVLIRRADAGEWTVVA